MVRVSIRGTGLEITADNGEAVYVGADELEHLQHQLARAAADPAIHEAALLSCVRPGWHALVRRLIAEMAHDFPTLEIVGVKQKFGQLRVHLQPHNPLAAELVSDYAGEASITCEECGSAGKMRSDRPRISILCDGHANH